MGSMMQLFLALAIISVACALPQPQKKNRIVGGSLVPIETYPFMASVQVSWYEDAFAHVCGGSLITRSAVLSAAHCFVFQYEAMRWRVRVGSATASAGGAHIPIARFINHPDFVHMLMIHDVAIVRLTTPAILSDTIRPARIAGPNYRLPDDLRVNVAGWGMTKFEDFDTSEYLLHTDVRVINHEICTKRYADLAAQPDIDFNLEVTPEKLCTGHLDVGGKDACQGDSGGPVIHGGDIVVGITSWGYECAHPRYPGVNARVSSYTPWIVENAVA